MDKPIEIHTALEPGEELFAAYEDDAEGARQLTLAMHIRRTPFSTTHSKRATIGL
jgi:hypothetical protein